MAVDGVARKAEIVTRAEAQAQGLTRFFTGKPCCHGHVDYRLVSNNTCSECARIRAKAHYAKRPEVHKEYYARNAEEIRRKSRELSRAKNLSANPAYIAELLYRKATKDQAKAAGATRYFTGLPCKHGHVAERFLSNGQCVACVRAWVTSHPETCKAISAAWTEKNREHVRRQARAAASTRRARKAQTGGRHTPADVEWLLNKQKNKCAHSWCRRSLARGYHVDHIVPIVRGGMSSRGNLQVLCPTCNLKKGSKEPIAWAQMNGQLL